MSRDHNVNIHESGGNEELTESVEELKTRLAMMKQLLAESEAKQGKNSIRSPMSAEYTARRTTLIDGSFLSAVFAVVFFLIVCVTFYAFQNLYYAVLKKFPSKHEEL